MTTRGKRRTPTAPELRSWRSFVEVSERIRSVIATRLEADSGLSMADYPVLLALSEADGHRLRPFELAELIAWDRTRLSHHLGRMQKRGLVERRDCLTDSRGVEVLMTAEGNAVFRRATAPHLVAIKSLFVEALTPEQLRNLDEINAALESHLDRNRGEAG